MMARVAAPCFSCRARPAFEDMVRVDFYYDHWVTALRVDDAGEQYDAGSWVERFITYSWCQPCYRNRVIVRPRINGYVPNADDADAGARH